MAALTVAQPAPRLARRATSVATLWGLLYALYRAYYAVGGTMFLPGTVRPSREGEFQAVNAVAVVVLLVAAVLPLAVGGLWSRPRVRQVLLALCWLVAVGCCMHALVDITQRVLSLSGHLSVSYPTTLWQSVDHRAADLQDLWLNEPWFFVEGVLFGLLAWPHLHTSSRRRWLTSAVVATALLTALGILSATGVIGRFVVG
jgi:fatty acid desaturase